MRCVKPALGCNQTCSAVAKFFWANTKSGCKRTCNINEGVGHFMANVDQYMQLTNIAFSQVQRHFLSLLRPSPHYVLFFRSMLGAEEWNWTELCFRLQAKLNGRHYTNGSDYNGFRSFRSQCPSIWRKIEWKMDAACSIHFRSDGRKLPNGPRMVVWTVPKPHPLGREAHSVQSNRQSCS